MNPLLAVPLILLAVSASAATCPIASFGSEKKELCRGDCDPMMLPDEMKRIRRGIYTEDFGGAIGDGIRGRWLGVNLDTAEFLSVELVPDRERPAKAPKSTTIRKAPKFGVLLVRKRGLSKPQLEELVCAANRVWKAPDLEPNALVHITRALYLRHGPAVKEFGGSEASGEAAPLLKLLKDMDAVDR